MSRTVWGRSALLGVALLASAMGCARSGPTGPATGDGSRFQVLADSPDAGPSAAPAASPGAGEAALPFPFLNALDLSADQRERIRAIITKYQPARDEDALRRWGQQFKEELARPVLDEAALRALLKTAEQKRRDGLLQQVPMFYEIRCVLTDAQRSSAGDAIQENLRRAGGEASPAPQASPEASPAASPEAAPATSPAAAAPVGPALTLSDAQKRLFKAMIPPRIDRRAAAGALASYMRTGDNGPLCQALTPKQTVDERVDAAVAALASLTAEQRQALVNYKPAPPGASPAPSVAPSCCP
jgi:Spy/CpxP family protein refolding chaperone